MLNKIYRFFFEEKHSTALGMFRIAFGLLVLLSFVYEFGQVSELYSNEGYFSNSYTRTSLFRNLRFSIFDYIGDPVLVHVIYFAFLIVMVMFTLGYHTKYLKFVQFFLLVSFHERNYLLWNSGDTLLRVMSFYLMLSPCGKSVSLDVLREKSSQKIKMWGIRLMQFQIMAVYFFAGITKFGKDMWMDGTAVNFILRNSIFNRFSMDWIIHIPYVIMGLTWLFLAVELSFPVLVWLKHTRIPILVLGAIMHIGILVFIDVGWFSIITMSSYILFLKESEALAVKNFFAKRLSLYNN